MSGAIFNRRTDQYPCPENAPTGTVCRRIFIPDDPIIEWAIRDVLVYLGSPDVWIPSENVTSEEIAAAIMEAFNDFVEDNCS